jgi:hypothetical protein
VIGDEEEVEYDGGREGCEEVAVVLISEGWRKEARERAATAYAAALQLGVERWRATR